MQGQFADLTDSQSFVHMRHIKGIFPELVALLCVIAFVLAGDLLSDTDRTPALFSSGDAGQVIVVYDGDTIKIRFDDGRVCKARLIGIDTPEIEDERQDVRFLAYTAKRFTFFHLYRRRIKIAYDWERTDSYGRLLVYVWSEEVGLFNEFILKEGYAFAFIKFPFNSEYKKRFIAAERQARDLEKGLWQKEPPPVIAAEDADDHVGKLLVVRYLCKDTRTRGNFVFLNSGENFSAVIPRAQISLFPEIDRLEGNVLSVKGFLETYKGKPQIMVFLPLQLRSDE